MESGEGEGGKNGRKGVANVKMEEVEEAVKRDDVEDVVLNGGMDDGQSVDAMLEQRA